VVAVGTVGRIVLCELRRNPIENAICVELMLALNSSDALTSLQLIETNRALHFVKAVLNVLRHRSHLEAPAKGKNSLAPQAPEYLRPKLRTLLTYIACSVS